MSVAVTEKKHFFTLMKYLRKTASSAEMTPNTCISTSMRTSPPPPSPATHYSLFLNSPKPKQVEKYTIRL